MATDDVLFDSLLKQKIEKDEDDALFDSLLEQSNPTIEQPSDTVITIGLKPPEQPLAEVTYNPKKAGFWETIAERVKGTVTTPVELAKTAGLGFEVLTGTEEPGERKELYQRTIEPFTEAQTLIPTAGALVGGVTGGVLTGGLGAGVGAALGSTAAQQAGEWFNALPETSFASKAANIAFDIGGLGLGRLTKKGTTALTAERPVKKSFAEQMQIEALNPNAPSQLLGVIPRSKADQRIVNDLNRVFNDPNSEVGQTFFNRSVVDSEGIEYPSSPKNIFQAKEKATALFKKATEDRSNFLQNLEENYGDLELKKDSSGKTAIEKTEPWKRLQTQIQEGLNSGNLIRQQEAQSLKDYLNSTISGYKTGTPLTLKNIQSEIDSINEELKELGAYESRVLGQSSIDPKEKLKFETLKTRQAALMQVREQALEKASPEIKSQFERVNKEYQDSKDLERSFKVIEESQSTQRAKIGKTETPESMAINPLGFATGSATGVPEIGFIGGAVNQLGQAYSNIKSFFSGRDPVVTRMQTFDKKTQESLQLLKNRQTVLQSGQLPNRRPIINPDGSIGRTISGIGSIAELLGVAQATIPTRLNTELVTQSVDDWAYYIGEQAAVALPGETPESARIRSDAMVAQFLKVMESGTDKEKRKMLAELQSLGLIPNNPYNEIDGKIELPQDRQKFTEDKKAELTQTGDVIRYAKQLNAMSNPYDGSIVTDAAKTKQALEITTLANQFRL